ncbi:Nucleoside-diphosphate-sugar epimerase [Raineyella antarctica]|uniref:Nucleoside-diphosphate-sugar epimerase n=1 Tax=Raineyella antarctica TaxID=1577474 RepID=A0A1G6GEJ4_9ACTN|nr:D-erythronate dehydrogenase [Raineyella antarctica]SDB80421.1 Nucleoside-diphosphate-sugar epimerase [Raineyella antarctica]
MNIVVTGGAGFLGSRVIRLLLERKDQGTPPIAFDRIVSFDLVESPVDDPHVTSVVGDIADPALIASVITPDTVAVYHLAAVLSGGSEDDFDLAMRVNVDGTRALLEAARTTGTRPRFLFTSSLAVFGGPMPARVPENLATQPESTYGAFKAIGELLVNEYSRKGFVDGRVLRLPTISVRPGRPNSAASSFASGILREPLNGVASSCPVPQDTRMWLSSPDTAVRNLVHALEVDGAELGQWRTLNLPGISVTVGQMLDSLERVGGTEARALVTDEPDQRVMDIVCSWPGDFDVERPLALGFARDESFDEVVAQYRDEFVPAH